MIALLLAAGVGRRLGVDHPKVLLEIAGRTLLDRHLEVLESAGVPLRVVTGHRPELLRQRLPGAQFVHNPEYRRGSLLSLSAGLDGLHDDVLIMDADVLYDPSILRDVMELERGLAIDPRTEPKGEEMMVGVRHAKARAIRRGRLQGFDQTGETVGFLKIDSSHLPQLRSAITVSDPEGDYEAAVDRFLDQHGADVVDVGGRAWIEIDFPEDLARAHALARELDG